MKTPFGLAGSNLDFFPLGTIARRTGIIHIRRAIGDLPVYRQTLRSFIAHLVGRHENLIWSIEGGRSRTGKLRPPRFGLLRYVVDAVEQMDTEDVYLVPFPLFHASGRVHGVYPALLTGGSCVLYDRFSARLFAERAAKSGGTITNFLGSMIKLILDQPASDYDQQSRLRSVQAVPTPFSIIGEFQRRFGVENVAEVLGMTELSWPVMSPYGEPRPPGAAGRPSFSMRTSLG